MGNQPTDELEKIFEELYRTHARGIYRFFANRGYSPETCQELTQETFMEVFKSLSRLHDLSGAKAWIFKIATNIWRNEIRRVTTDKRKGQAVPIDNVSEATFLGASEASRAPDGALKKMIDDELVQLLRLELGRLPPQMRRCVQLRAQGMKYREIADSLQLSVQTVKSQIHQAKPKLKEQLSEHFTDLNI